MKDTLRIRTGIDPMDPMHPIYTGTFTQNVTVGGKTRRVTFYLPENVMPSTSGLMILPPSGMSGTDFLAWSNWRMLAETEENEEKFMLCILESGEDGWNTAEEYGRSDGDLAYVRAVYRLLSARTHFCVHEAKRYLIGYGSGGTMAQMAAMDQPTGYAGLTCVCSEPVSRSYREAVEKERCIDLFGFCDTAGAMGIYKKDVPLPVWMIAGNDIQEAECMNDLHYWTRANGAVIQAGRVAKDTIAFVCENEPESPKNQDREARRVWLSLIPAAAEHLAADVNRRIWKQFLSGVCRWRSEVCGSLRLNTRPILDPNCEYHYELVGGWMREWYVYIPRSVRENPEHKTPVVVACHGYSCTGAIYLGNTRWHRLADRHGFIVIAPTACFDHIPSREADTELPAWNLFGKPNKPDETVFFSHMLAELGARYAIDEERIYATGHSWGAMMAQYLAMAMPGTFVAVGSCSGVIFAPTAEQFFKNPQIVKHPHQETAVWMIVGEREGYLMEHLPEGENAAARNIRLWWDRDRYPLAAPTDFSEGWRVSGRWHDLAFIKERKPLIRYTWVENLPHGTMPEMSERLWCEFFAKVRRDAQSGMIYYA